MGITASQAGNSGLLPAGQPAKTGSDDTAESIQQVIEDLALGAIHIGDQDAIVSQLNAGLAPVDAQGDNSLEDKSAAHLETQLAAVASLGTDATGQAADPETNEESEALCSSKVEAGDSQLPDEVREPVHGNDKNCANVDIDMTPPGAIEADGQGTIFDPVPSMGDEASPSVRINDVPESEPFGEKREAATPDEKDTELSTPCDEPVTASYANDELMTNVTAPDKWSNSILQEAASENSGCAVQDEIAQDSLSSIMINATAIEAVEIVQENPATDEHSVTATASHSAPCLSPADTEGMNNAATFQDADESETRPGVIVASTGKQSEQAVDEQAMMKTIDYADDKNNVCSDVDTFERVNPFPTQTLNEGAVIAPVDIFEGNEESTALWTSSRTAYISEQSALAQKASAAIDEATEAVGCAPGDVVSGAVFTSIQPKTTEDIADATNLHKKEDHHDRDTSKGYNASAVVSVAKEAVCEMDTVAPKIASQSNEECRTLGAAGKSREFMGARPLVEEDNEIRASAESAAFGQPVDADSLQPNVTSNVASVDFQGEDSVHELDSSGGVDERETQTDITAEFCDMAAVLPESASRANKERQTILTATRAAVISEQCTEPSAFDTRTEAQSCSEPHVDDTPSHIVAGLSLPDVHSNDAQDDKIASNEKLEIEVPTCEARQSGRSVEAEASMLENDETIDVVGNVSQHDASLKSKESGSQISPELIRSIGDEEDPHYVEPFQGNHEPIVSDVSDAARETRIFDQSREGQIATTLRDGAKAIKDALCEKSVGVEADPSEPDLVSVDLTFANARSNDDVYGEDIYGENDDSVAQSEFISCDKDLCDLASHTPVVVSEASGEHKVMIVLPSQAGESDRSTSSNETTENVEVVRQVVIREKKCMTETHAAASPSQFTNRFTSSDAQNEDERSRQKPTERDALYNEAVVARGAISEVPSGATRTTSVSDRFVEVTEETTGNIEIFRESGADVESESATQYQVATLPHITGGPEDSYRDDGKDDISSGEDDASATPPVVAVSEGAVSTIVGRASDITSESKGEDRTSDESMGEDRTLDSATSEASKCERPVRAETATIVREDTTEKIEVVTDNPVRVESKASSFHVATRASKVAPGAPKENQYREQVLDVARSRTSEHDQPVQDQKEIGIVAGDEKSRDAEATSQDAVSEMNAASDSNGAVVPFRNAAESSASNAQNKDAYDSELTASEVKNENDCEAGTSKENHDSIIQTQVAETKVATFNKNTGKERKDVNVATRNDCDSEQVAEARDDTTQTNEHHGSVETGPSEPLVDTTPSGMHRGCVHDAMIPGATNGFAMKPKSAEDTAIGSPLELSSVDDRSQEVPATREASSFERSLTTNASVMVRPEFIPCDLASHTPVVESKASGEHKVMVVLPSQVGESDRSTSSNETTECIEVVSQVVMRAATPSQFTNRFAGSDAQNEDELSSGNHQKPTEGDGLYDEAVVARGAISEAPLGATRTASVSDRLTKAEINVTEETMGNIEIFRESRADVESESATPYQVATLPDITADPEDPHRYDVKDAITFGEDDASATPPVVAVSEVAVSTIVGRASDSTSESTGEHGTLDSATSEPSKCERPVRAETTTIVSEDTTENIEVVTDDPVRAESKTSSFHVATSASKIAPGLPKDQYREQVLNVMTSGTSEHDQRVQDQKEIVIVVGDQTSKDVEATSASEDAVSQMNTASEPNGAVVSFQNAAASSSSNTQNKDAHNGNLTVSEAKKAGIARENHDSVMQPQVAETKDATFDKNASKERKDVNVATRNACDSEQVEVEARDDTTETDEHHGSVETDLSGPLVDKTSSGMNRECVHDAMIPGATNGCDYTSVDAPLELSRVDDGSQEVPVTREASSFERSFTTNTSVVVSDEPAKNAEVLSENPNREETGSSGMYGGDATTPPKITTDLASSDVGREDANDGKPFEDQQDSTIQATLDAAEIAFCSRAVEENQTSADVSSHGICQSERYVVIVSDETNDDVEVVSEENANVESRLTETKVPAVPTQTTASVVVSDEPAGNAEVLSESPDREEAGSSGMYGGDTTTPPKITADLASSDVGREDANDGKPIQDQQDSIIHATLDASGIAFCSRAVEENQTPADVLSHDSCQSERYVVVVSDETNDDVEVVSEDNASVESRLTETKVPAVPTPTTADLFPSDANNGDENAAASESKKCTPQLEVAAGTDTVWSPATTQPEVATGTDTVCSTAVVEPEAAPEANVASSRADIVTMEEATVTTVDRDEMFENVTIVGHGVVGANTSSLEPPVGAATIFRQGTDSVGAESFGERANSATDHETMRAKGPIYDMPVVAPAVISKDKNENRSISGSSKCTISLENDTLKAAESIDFDSGVVTEMLGVTRTCCSEDITLEELSTWKTETIDLDAFDSSIGPGSVSILSFDESYQVGSITHPTRKETGGRGTSWSAKPSCDWALCFQ